MIAWYYLVLIGAVFYTIAILIEKGALAVEYASAYSSSVCLVAALISLLLLPFADFSMSLYYLALIFIYATFNAIVYLLTARVYKHSSITVSSPVLSSLPQFFVVILAFEFLGEQLSPLKYISIGVLLVAIYLIMFKSDRKHKHPFERRVYIYFLLVTTALSAVGAILLKYALYGVSPITYLILMQAVMSVEMLVYMHFHYGGLRETVRNTRRFALPIFATAIFTVVYRLFYYFAVSGTFISLASPLLTALTVVLTVLAGALIFKEDDLKRRLLLSLVMIVAILFLVF